MLTRQKGTVEDADIFIPLHIFQNRKVSVLEAIAVHLKDTKRLTFHEIASLMKRNDRTIWTSYTRGKKKLT